MERFEDLNQEGSNDDLGLTMSFSTARPNLFSGLL